MTLIKPSRKIKISDPARAMNSRLQDLISDPLGRESLIMTYQKSLPSTGILTIIAAD